MKIKYFAWIKDITGKEFDIILENYPKNIDDLKKYLKNLIQIYEIIYLTIF